MKARDLYSQEPARLASYCPEKLQILHSSAVPKRLVNLLPPPGGRIVGGDLSCVELDSGQLSAALEKEPMPRPYWDPSSAGPRSTWRAFCAGYTTESW